MQIPAAHGRPELGLPTSPGSSLSPGDVGKPTLCFPHSFEARFAFHLLLLQCLKLAFFVFSSSLEGTEQSIARPHVFVGLGRKNKL